MWALVSRSTSLSWPRRACIVAEYRKLCLLCLFLAADADVPLLASEPVLLRRWAVATMLAGRMWGESYPPEVSLSDAQRVRHASSYRMRTSMQGAVHSAPLWVSVSVTCKGHAFGRCKSCRLCGISVLREATLGSSNTLHEGGRIRRRDQERRRYYQEAIGSYMQGNRRTFVTRFRQYYCMA